MKKTAFIILTLLTLTGCGESFDTAYDAFQSPLNSIPSVSVQTIPGWQTSPATVSGSASDSDNDPLTYRWSEVTSYGVTFSAPASTETSVTFTGNDNGDVAVTAVLRLTVSDGEDESYQDMNLQIYRNDVIFVTPAGTGSGNNPDSPLNGGSAANLAGAITYANNSGKKIVALSAGIYAISTTPTSPALVLKEGISLYGGFSPSDWMRNIQTNESIIRDMNVYTTTAEYGAIRASTGITKLTSLNGIVVEIGRGSWAIGILCYSSTGLTVKDCTVRSRTDGSDLNTNQQFGILLNNCGEVVIEDCKIAMGAVEYSLNTYSVGIFMGGTGNVTINRNYIYSGESKTTNSSNTFAYGINAINIASSAVLTITNNIISSGISENGSSSGISINSDGNTTYSFKIRNNTICVLNPFNKANAACIRILTSAGSELIENNVLIATGNSNSYCVFMNALHTPDSLRNNLFYIDTTTSNKLIYSNGISFNDLTTTIPVMGTNLLALGNITENLPNYVVDYDGPDNDILTLSDNDWHIVKDINTPKNLLYGGIDLSAEVLFDYDGSRRTNLNALKATNVGAGGFTIGAFEED
jgi:hypothetical protein